MALRLNWFSFGSKQRDADGFPSKPPPFDVDRALRVMVRPHPSLEKHRAANGELILIVQRELHPAEKFLARFFPLRRERRIVLDKYGEFMLEAASRPDATLAGVAEAMAREFDVDIEKTRLGVIHLVRALLVRGFVFLIQTPEGSPGSDDDRSDSGFAGKIRKKEGSPRAKGGMSRA